MEYVLIAIFIYLLALPVVLFWNALKKHDNLIKTMKQQEQNIHEAIARASTDREMVLLKGKLYRIEHFIKSLENDHVRNKK